MHNRHVAKEESRSTGSDAAEHYFPAHMLWQSGEGWATSAACGSGMQTLCHQGGLEGAPGTHKHSREEERLRLHRHELILLFQLQSNFFFLFS